MQAAAKSARPARRERKRPGKPGRAKKQRKTESGIKGARPMIAILPAGEAERAARAAEPAFRIRPGVCLTASDGTGMPGLCILSPVRRKGRRKKGGAFFPAGVRPTAGGRAASRRSERRAGCGRSNRRMRGERDVSLSATARFPPVGESGGQGEVIALIREIFNKGCLGGCHREHSGK